MNTFSRKSIRAVLRSWKNYDKLGKHPLRDLQIVEKRHRSKNRGDEPYEYGLSVQEILDEAIEQLRPSQGSPNYIDREWRYYLIVTKGLIRDQFVDHLADDLGISRRMYQYSESDAVDKLASILQQMEDEVRTVSMPPVVASVPFLAPPKQPYRLVGRHATLLELKGNLLAGGSTALCALNGLPGVGKTALALELAHDSEVLSHFQDGVLYAGLGFKPDVFSVLGVWARSLNIPSDEVARLGTVTERASAIHRALGMRHMLLLIDDAWQIEAALAFRLGGPHCAHLLTTRLPNIAHDFAEGKVIVVEGLSNAAGLVLFGQIAPQAAEAEPDEVQRIVQAVGGLPLPIVLMARHTRRRTGNEKNLLKSILGELSDTQGRLAILEPQSPVGSHPSLPVGAPISTLAVVEISTNALNEATRQTLYALSVFPPKPNSFSYDAASWVAAESSQALNRLIDAGLLEASGRDRYTLHQVLHDYAKSRRTDEIVYERMVSFFRDHLIAHEKDFDYLEPDRNNILVAIDIALEREMKESAVGLINAFSRFLEVRGLYDLGKDYLLRAVEVAREVNDSELLITTLLNLGIALEKQGNYDEAEACVREGMDLAKEHGHDEKVPALLHNLGRLFGNRGKLLEEEKHYQNALALARKLEQKERVCALLQNLGTVAYDQGAYDLAEVYYQEGLTLARDLSQRERMVDLLSNLGTMAISRGRYDEAELYLHKAMAVARELGHREAISYILVNLGNVAGNRGVYDQAEAYLQEGLTVAQEIGHRERVSHFLLNLGVVAGSSGKHDKAEQYFREGLLVAQELGHGVILASLLTNLGAALLEGGSYEEAAAHFQEGLTLAREMEHQWLIADALLGQGEVHLRQSCLDAATVAFCEALEVAQRVDIPEFTGKAKYGLAKISLARGDLVGAIHLGQESLDVLTSIEHGEASSVRTWLNELRVTNTVVEE